MPNSTGRRRRNLEHSPDRDAGPAIHHGDQSACLEIAQWTTRDYARVVQGEMAGWTAQEKNEVAGFIVARRVASDLEILNFAVRPDWRNRGVGVALLRQALDWGATFRAKKRSSRFALRTWPRFDSTSTMDSKLPGAGRATIWRPSRTR